MRTQFSISFLMVLLLLGCKDSGTNPEPSGDDLLSRAIVGTWSSSPPSYSQYSADGSFMDRWVIWRLEGQPPDTLTMIRTGKYTITDGTLYPTDIRTTNHTSSGQPWGYVSETHPFELAIREDTLWGTRVHVYTKAEGNTTELAGSWSTIFWTIHVRDTSLIPLYEGRAKYTYTFFPDSHRVKIQSQWLDVAGEPSQPTWTSYTYNAPFLDIGTGAPDRVRVLFKAGRMRWYHDNPTFHLVRVR